MKKKTKVIVLSEDKEIRFAINEILKKNKTIKILKKKKYISIEDLFFNISPDIFIFCELIKKESKQLNFLKQNMVPCIFFLNKEEELFQEIDIRIYPFKIIFKPFDYNDLISKIDLLKKNIENGFYQKFTIEEVTFHPSLQILLNKNSKVIKLTDKESSMLEYFFKNKNKVLTRYQLLLNLWGYKENITTNTLETHIYRLRKKLSLVEIRNKLIISKEGGYIFEFKGNN